MCRFVLYQGPAITISSLVTEPRHSLIHQSFHAEERAEPLNGDGFGLVWYVPQLQREPALFRSVSPAWSNANLRHLARVVQSPCILAHIRAATQGSVSEANCHPFVHRELAFMHNGDVAGFGRVRRPLRHALSDEAYDAIRGSTDSEHLFAMLIDRWRALESEPDPVRRLQRATVRTIRAVEELCAEVGVENTSQLNLALTDGRAAVITRYASGDAVPNTLYLCRGSGVECCDGLFRMLPGRSRAVVVASEPLSRDESWYRVPQDTMLVIDPEGEVAEHRLM